MEDIRRGRARSALLNLHNMQQDVSYLKRIGTTLDNERIGAAITRTSARIAALEAGLSPILVDRITTENTRIVMSAKSVSRILQAKEEMVLAICRAVAANSEHAHSALAQSALYYLEHEYYRKIRLDEMAADLETSRTKLIQVFRTEYGITPIEYLNRFRMQKAAFLLGSSDKNIQEISQIVGIGDANYFVKMFRRQYGKTPGEYRRQNKV
ncbi:MAG: AraC family transcriptional regulator [Lachnospiraceae bacterium]|jgi:YesN/AraC family two-component response regulator|nr:AraC family transcriptional regulator [Lachnospiraceae bacterium]